MPSNEALTLNNSYLIFNKKNYKDGPKYLAISNTHIFTIKSTEKEGMESKNKYQWVNKHVLRLNVTPQPLPPGI